MSMLVEIHSAISHHPVVVVQLWLLHSIMEAAVEIGRTLVDLSP